MHKLIFLFAVLAGVSLSAPLVAQTDVKPLSVEARAANKAWFDCIHDKLRAYDNILAPENAAASILAACRSHLDKLRDIRVREGAASPAQAESDNVTYEIYISRSELIPKLTALHRYDRATNEANHCLERTANEYALTAMPISEAVDAAFAKCAAALAQVDAVLAQTGSAMTSAADGTEKIRERLRRILIEGMEKRRAYSLRPSGPP